MRAVSQEAFEQTRQRWDALLAEKPGAELGFGIEAFSVADLLRANERLVSALTDVSRAPEARAHLVRSVLEGRVAEEIVELLEGMVRQNWSEKGDLPDSVGVIGVHSLLVSARSGGYLASVEGELHAARRLIAVERDFRLALSDKGRSSRSRVELARSVWAGKVGEETLALIIRAVECAPIPTVAASLADYMTAAAELASKLVASVTTASPLSVQQQERLVEILENRYGREVSVHVAVRPEVIGGMRIHVGDDVIDATLATRIRGVKDAITK